MYSVPACVPQHGTTPRSELAVASTQARPRLAQELVGKGESNEGEPTGRATSRNHGEFTSQTGVCGGRAECVVLRAQDSHCVCSDVIEAPHNDRDEGLKCTPCIVCECRCAGLMRAQLASQ